MTQAEQREYMIKYLKSQGNNWKMGQLKKLKPDELKEEFDKCVEKVEKFIPMNSELEASKLKRTGINLQAEVFKKQKITDVPDVTKDESVKREEEFKVQQPILRYNIRKSLARKGLQKNKSESARSDTEEDVEAYMDEGVDEASLDEFQMGSIPQGSAPAKIVKWQILKTGKKGAYQIIREDHTDVVYVNFQGLLNDLTRDDLKELYRLMVSINMNLIQQLGHGDQIDRDNLTIVYVLASDDEIQALVQKQIDEDMVHQKAILDLALQFDNACTTKEDLRKAYEKCNHIPQEIRALIDIFFKKGSDKDYELNLSMYRKAAKLEKQMNAKLAWIHEKYNHRSETHIGGSSSQTHEIGDVYLTAEELHQLHLDEEALRETLEEQTMDEKAREEKIRQKQADDDEYFMEFGVMRIDSDYESSD
ncbi:hypothetical protein Tco_0960149 [Tanacetum coccineum]